MWKASLNRRKFLASAMGIATMGIGIPSLKGRPAPAPGASSGFPKPIALEEQHWITVHNRVYGARPDIAGPTGGGRRYSRTFSDGDFVVADLEQLLLALKEAKPGQVIFIPSENTIDLTTRIYIEELVLEIPEGVTLAGSRGDEDSKGALLKSDALKTPVMIQAKGPGVRITGLRIQGPNPERHLEHHKRSFGPEGLGRDYYYKFPVSRGIISDFSVRVDNCDISAFSGSAISLRKGSGHHIHHNYIHHCQYNGLGYGISHAAASSLIEHNLFDHNRHSIAGTGVSGCGYVARNNVELGTSLSHCFDMHGGRDRKDGTEVAGTFMEIYNNTFYPPEPAVAVRGIPEEKCAVYQNWFIQHAEPSGAVRGLSNKTTATDNVYGKSPFSVK